MGQTHNALATHATKADVRPITSEYDYAYADNPMEGTSSGSRIIPHCRRLPPIHLPSIYNNPDYESDVADPLYVEDDEDDDDGGT